MSDEFSKIGFGGGCHWCTEAVYKALRGVETVEQGFIRSVAPDDRFSEAVVVTWRPDEIPLEVLIEIHLRTHASTSDHKMRGKYRSAIYSVSEDQTRKATDILDGLRASERENYVTRIIPFVEFKASDDRFHNYAEKNAGNQFCTRYIDPKLDRLRAEYGRFLRQASN
jgi:peptide-methionine (S)-S-oxide reductase